ncbi:hypothetical protein [uncultured Friedmanniella sp.]|uniref:hypothetical protein n=1 Tax=uncultured Friedmanniella sp. TaxID=335381 RepID=UPI0035CA6FA5
MTESLTVVRAELVDDLEGGGFLVTEHLDQGVKAPAVVIGCGNPYLTPAELLRPDELVVSLELFLLFRAAQRDAMTTAVNRGVQDLLLAIDDRWTFLDASAPFRATNLPGNPPVCRVRITANVRITTPEGTN